jgi:hypothetical protein
MPRQTTHIQPGDDEARFETGEGTRALNSDRIVRRLVLEAILPLAEWAEDKDVLTRQMVQSTARKQSLYEQGSNWLDLLESFTRKRIEIMVLRKEVTLLELLLSGKSEPVVRMQELAGAREDTLLACWHQNHGILAVTWPEIEGIPRGLTPQCRALGPSLDGEALSIWSWDKRNFPKRE